MTAPRRLAALVPLLAAGALVLPVGAAHADTRVVRDAAHDVVAGSPDEEVPEGVDPSRTQEDVLGLRVSHRAHSVRAVVSYAALTPASARGVEVVHVLEVRTNEGVRAGMYLDVPADGSRPGGQLLWDGERRAPERCRGAVARIDRGARTVTFTIPRRCLSQPRWVRVGAGAGAISQDKLYADDALVRGSVGHDLALGPRVRR